MTAAGNGASFGGGGDENVPEIGSDDGRTTAYPKKH